MALSIHELASRIASGQQDTFSTFDNVPLTFLSEDYSITQQRAITMLRNQKEPTQLWTCLNVTREQMERFMGKIGFARMKNGSGEVMKDNVV